MNVGSGVRRKNVPGGMVIRVPRTWGNSKLNPHPCSSQKKDFFSVTNMPVS